MRRGAGIRGYVPRSAPVPSRVSAAPSGASRHLLPAARGEGKNASRYKSVIERCYVSRRGSLRAPQRPAPPITCHHRSLRHGSRTPCGRSIGRQIQMRERADFCFRPRLSRVSFLDWKKFDSTVADGFESIASQTREPDVARRLRLALAPRLLAGTGGGRAGSARPRGKARRARTRARWRRPRRESGGRGGSQVEYRVGGCDTPRTSRPNP